LLGSLKLINDLNVPVNYSLLRSLFAPLFVVFNKHWITFAWVHSLLVFLAHVVKNARIGL